MITYNQLLEKIYDPIVIDKLKNLLHSGKSAEFYNLYHDETNKLKDKPKVKKNKKTIK